MNREKFTSLLAVAITPAMVEIIKEKRNLDELAAAKLFVESEVYALLEKEETKLWHYSPLTLYNMLVSEIEAGKIDFPEGI